MKFPRKYIHKYQLNYSHVSMHTDGQTDGRCFNRHSAGLQPHIKQYRTFISVALETGTNFPAVSTISLLAILMMKQRLRTKGTGVPTHSQPHAASLTLSACNTRNQTKYRFQYLYSEVFYDIVNFNLILEHNYVEKLSYFVI